MPVQAERFDDEGFELAGEEIGEEKGGDVVVPAAGEIPVAGEEGITVRAGDALDLFNSQRGSRWPPEPQPLPGSIKDQAGLVLVSGRFFGGLIDDLGGDRGQGNVRRLLFVERRLKQLGGVFHAQLQRPGPQRAVA
ncbi:hypothetical protein D9M69_124750 [compost metagenome]